MDLSLDSILHLGGYTLLGIFGFIVLMKSFVIVSGDEVVVLERRWFGSEIKDGRIFALSNEVGIQVRNLMPGFHFLVPFLYTYTKFNLINIKEDEVGIIESFDGQPLPTNRMFAKKINGHSNFQDGESFLKNGGQKGIQVETLPPGDYRINPKLFSIKIVKVITINENQVGLISAKDGAPLREGQLFADSIPNYSDYQDIDYFLNHGGQKGPQINVLKPAQYRLNTYFWTVEIIEVTKINSDEIGLVTANAGLPLPKTEVVAIQIDNHSNFQDGQAFLDNGGQKGPQIEVLRSGYYYLNTQLFTVTKTKQLEIPTGYVGVVTSYVGKEPEKPIENALSGSQNKIKPETSEDLIVETTTVSEKYKGIQGEILRPGKYPINTFAYSVQQIDITNISIEWASNLSNNEKEHFKPLQVLSQDGFPLTVDVQVIVRVNPSQAPFLVSKVGTTKKLIKDVIDPIISSSFRNQASAASAISFLKDRSEEQKKSEEHVRNELAKYNVECVSVLITNIEIPKELMETQTKRIIAEQEIQQFIMQQKSAEEKVKTEKAIAQAAQQSHLVAAEINVQVAAQNKLAQITEAEANAQAAKLAGQGEKDKMTLIGDGEAYKIKVLAEANAEQIEKLGQASADAYKKQAESLGQDGIVSLEQLKLIPNALKGQKLVPDIVVGESGNASSAFWAQFSRVLPTLSKSLSNLDLSKLNINTIVGNGNNKQDKKEEPKQ